MNNKGFALAVTMALLPALVGLGLFLFASLGIMQFNLKSQQICRMGGLQGQRRVAPLLKELLGLNPKAIKLKTDETLAQARLAAAIFGGNPAAITAATARLEKIQAERRKLDSRQKTLIKESNRALYQQHRRTRGQVQRSLREGLSSFSYLKIESQLNSSSAPELAVRPDYSDVAPTYSTLEDFEEKQALAHSWQYRLRVRNSFQDFLDGDIRWSPSCSVTLKKEGMSWIPKIRKVKSSSKSS